MKTQFRISAGFFLVLLICYSTRVDSKVRELHFVSVGLNLPFLFSVSLAMDLNVGGRQCKQRSRFKNSE